MMENIETGEFDDEGDGPEGVDLTIDPKTDALREAKRDAKRMKKEIELQAENIKVAKELETLRKKKERQDERVVEGITGIVSSGEPSLSAFIPVGPPDRKTAAVLPEQETIRIFRRDVDGKLHLVNDYSTFEIQKDGDVGTFVNKRIRPNFGDFDYEVCVVKQGRVAPWCTIAKRKSREDENEGSGSLLRTLADILAKEREATAKAVPVTPPPVNAVDDMAKLLGVLNGQQKLDPMQLMMVPMIRDALRSMSDQRPTGERSELYGLVTKIIERMEEMDARLSKERDRQEHFPTIPMAPELPPPPPIDYAGMIRAMAEVMRPVPPPPGPPPITIEDMLAFAEKMRPPEQAPKASLFDDPIVKLIAPKLIEKFLNDGTSKKIEALELQITKAQNESRHQDSGGNRSLRDLMLEQLEIREVASKLAPRPAPQPIVGDGFWREAISSLPRILAQAKDLVSTMRQPGSPGNAPPETAQGEEEELGIPDGLEDVIAAIDVATDDEGVLRGAMGILEKLSKETTWKRYIVALVTRAKQGNKPGTLGVIKGIANILRDSNLLTQESTDRIVKTVARNIDTVVAALDSPH